MIIYELVEKLVLYSIENGFVDSLDEVLIRNKILEELNLIDYKEFKEDERKRFIKEIKKYQYPCELLDGITEWAGENGILEENILVFKDLLNSKIMGTILPRTSEITRNFWNKYENNKESSTNYFYNISKKSNYIRTDRISKNIEYKYPSKYGNLEITINLSKPEKDPKEIALSRNKVVSMYPKSLLCKENEGYMGRIDHPGRQNHRIIKLKLTEEDWYFQYSPYTYYNEHSIIFSSEIRPMKIDKRGFRRLIEFVELFPHYFIGSNADLPIVGGSILSHDHFQAGRHSFAMDSASITTNIEFKNYREIEVGILNWPLSVIRLKTELHNKEKLLELSDKVLNKWIKYSDYENDILSHSDEVRHNTITPIVRIKDEKIEMDLVLRNNRTTEEYPLGIFHPHSEHHSIKKENIGLIEVMGLAVLPGRLKYEMEKLKKILEKEKEIKNILEIMKLDIDLEKHIEWVEENFTAEMLNKEEIEKLIQKVIGKTFEKVLEDCGVFKNTEIGRKGFIRFLENVD